MDKKSLIISSSFLAIFILIIIWVRLNLDVMRPILLNSTLFFQLMIAVTFIAVLRNFVGVKSFGVFGPTIVTFGIVQAGLILGLTMYLNLFIIGMIASLILYRFKISSGYRVAIIISMMVIVITFLELVGEAYHISIFETAIFLPILITSWLADRFVVQVKEVDWIETSKKLIGTLLIIILVYFLITFKPLIEYITLNPEVWIILILLNLSLALKSDLRLSDSSRFKKIFDRKKDILSLNARNRDFVAKYNPPNLYSSLSKDHMKIAFHQLDLPTPQTYAIIEKKEDISIIDKIATAHSSFVVKPTKGLGGEGILVLDSKNEKKEVFTNSREEFTISDIKNHINQILTGQFTNGNEDNAIIEEKIEVSKQFNKYFGKGVFDIRVIVFYGFPVMSMIRIPTKESKGLANIHKGAISMGIEISTGKALNPYWKAKNASITKHPDTHQDLTNLKIPSWNTILKLACLAQGASKLNYVGVDIVYTNKGPVVLEVNKRPGLEIQNANLEGLLKRLKFLELKLSSIRFNNIYERIKLVKEFDKRKWN